MKQIPLSQGKVTLVDDEDYERLSMFKWHYSAGYARHNYQGLMHRLILSVEAGYEVDHINGDKLDNRRSNLRMATHKQNSANRKTNVDSISQIKGVSWNVANKKWKARICNGLKDKHLGYFETAAEAQKAYMQAAKEAYGEFAS